MENGTFWDALLNRKTGSVSHMITDLPMTTHAWPPYEEIYGKFYVDCNGSLRTITWKDDDDDDDYKKYIYFQLLIKILIHWW